jgi:ABC-type polysaccharide/polyol phosphate transport system ATPase subunit
LETQTSKIISDKQVVTSPAPGSVVLEGVSKSFRKRTIQRKSYTSVKSALLERFRPKPAQDNNILKALDTISVNIEPGSSLGIIGRNGSGKSTMLKLISGIYQADSGVVSVNGKISALIELGAGFHPEFSGRENVFLGGVMFGLSKREIEERFDDIVAYAELEQHIDDPVKTYSSGMYMRLGFSLAIHTDPDILLIDEVLAVGDAAFIHRCHETISDFKRRGKTMIFVTHDLSSVSRWCDEVIWLHQGEVVKRGEPRYVVDSYLQAIEAVEEQQLEAKNSDVDDSVQTEANDSEPGGVDSDSESTKKTRWGNGDVEITAVRMKDSSGEAKWLFHEDDDVLIEVDYVIHKSIDELVFGVGILRADGVAVHGTNTDIDDVSAPLPASEELEFPLKGTYCFDINRLGLVADSYFLDLAIHKSDGTPYDYHHRQYQFSVRSSAQHHGIYNPKHQWSFRPAYASVEEKKS